MATDTPLRPADSAAYDDDRGGSQSRPAPPVYGWASRLRRLIGIEEGLLSWVPEERPRYTWYGALVVNTALLGAISMVLALSSFRSDLPLAAVLGVAVVWFWVILALDSWLVSSTHGTGVRKWTLLVRFFLSVLLGLFIAEPILFQIFDKEIRQEIAVGNEQRVADYRGMLVSCNPTDGAATTDRAECARYQLKVAGSPAELARQIDTNGDRAAALRTQVADINKTLNDKLATEQRLCGPKYWISRGGVRDVTITCERARKATSEYEKNSKVKTYEKQLEGMVAQGRTLSARKDRAADGYQPALQKAIDDKTRQRAGPGHRRHPHPRPRPQGGRRVGRLRPLPDDRAAPAPALPGRHARPRQGPQRLHGLRHPPRRPAPHEPQAVLRGTRGPADLRPPGARRPSPPRPAGHGRPYEPSGPGAPAGPGGARGGGTGGTGREDGADHADARGRNRCLIRKFDETFDDRNSALRTGRAEFPIPLELNSPLNSTNPSSGTPLGRRIFRNRRRNH